MAKGDTIMTLIEVPKNFVINLERRVVKEGKRFKIYLPKAYNSLWSKLSEMKKKVKIIIIVEG